MDIIRRVSARFRIVIQDLALKKSGKKNYTRTISISEDKDANVNIDSVMSKIKNAFNDGKK